MALDGYNTPEICNLLNFIDREKEKVQTAICDFYFGLYEQIDFTWYDEGKVLANGIVENRDFLLKLIDKQLESLEDKVMRLPEIREEIVKFADEKLYIRNIDQPDSSSDK